MSKRILLFILIPIAATSCERDSPTKKFDPKSVLECMHAQHSNDDYVLETTCSPLGKPKTFNGTWFVGFEESLFMNNYIGVPAGLIDGSDLYEIVVPAELAAKVQPGPQGVSSAYQVSLIGRESYLRGLGGRKVLVLDRVISIRPVKRNLNVQGR